MVLRERDVREIFERPTFARFLRAYDYRLTRVDGELERLVGLFIKKVKKEAPTIYRDYDSSSFMINDALQPILIELLREQDGPYDYLDGPVFRTLFQSRLIRNGIKEWGKKNNLAIGEEVASMFAWYCKHEHGPWFEKFYPEEMHMGGYRWDDDIAGYWSRFIRHCNQSG